MRHVKVKVCGITSEEDLNMVCSMGADAVGFVVGVPSSPRNLTVEKAEKLIKLVPLFVKSVLVVVPHDESEVLNYYKRLKPDIIQIHGEKPFDAGFLKKKLFGTPLVRAVNMKSEELLNSALQESKFFDAVLADSSSSDKYGGTGLIHDWSVSKRVREAIHPKPLILAGGLNPENVQEAIKAVKPYAVDVSTGVESKPGVKDFEKVAAFIRNAKALTIEDDWASA
ncbi:MAG: phosphoribosylanthranilate isomerase [Candidatus Bathyarchaeia archaeon]